MKVLVSMKVLEMSQKEFSKIRKNHYSRFIYCPDTQICFLVWKEKTFTVKIPNYYPSYFLFSTPGVHDLFFWKICFTIINILWSTQGAFLCHIKVSYQVFNILKILMSILNQIKKRLEKHNIFSFYYVLT